MGQEGDTMVIVMLVSVTASLRLEPPGAHIPVLQIV